MAVPPSRPGRKANGNDVETAKRNILSALADGKSLEEALVAADRRSASHNRYRRADKEYAAAVDRLVNLRRGRLAVAKIPPFEEFSETYLGHRVFPHMLNVVDMIEGNEPRWTHEAMVYERGEPDLAIVNMPPEHSKSTTVTMNYVTYRINKDPNVRVLIVSKTQAMANKFLYGIKTRLTHPKYKQMHAMFGPVGGWDNKSESWSQNRIYVSAESLDGGEKDPTVEALGIRGHIYGARADLIILDDCVDGTNTHDFEKQIDWIQSEVLSRLSASGMCLVVGTRLAPRDLYSELRNPSRYPDEQSPWTYLSMPAVLQFDEKPERWVTLWPRSNQPEMGARGEMAVADKDGLFPKWDGKRLFKKRARMQPRTWAMVYQQQQVVEDAIFHPDAVAAAVNPNRRRGRIPEKHGTRVGGMTGLVVVAGMDPAMSGFTAATVIGLDVMTQKRYVLDVVNRQGMSPDAIRELIKEWTDRFGIVEWRIEKNAFQSMLTQDREVREALAMRGCILREHTTGVNKWDPDFGVASLTTLFEGWRDNRMLIEFPSTYESEGMKALVEQLVTWQPALPKHVKTDCVMSLWFAEIACRERIQALTVFGRSHVRNSFLTPWDRSRQQVVSLQDADAWTPLTGAGSA